MDMVLRTELVKWFVLLNGMLWFSAAMALPPPTNLCVERNGQIICESGGTALTKWHPGHYAMAWPGEFNKAYLDKIAREKHITGIRGQLFWREIEPTKGRYDFSVIEKNLRMAQARGKRLIMMIGYKAWNKNAKTMLCAPKDLVDSGGVRQVVKGSNKRVCVARIWRDDVKNRLISLIRAMGARFDKEPYFEGIVLTETANNGGREDVLAPTKGNNAKYLSGYSDKKYFDSTVEIAAEARKAFPHTNVFQMANYIASPVSGESSRQAMAKLFKALYDSGLGVGDPDLICCTKSPNPTRAQRKSYTGRMPLLVENQNISKRWTKYKQTPAMAFYSAIDDPEGFHANYVVWFLQGSKVPELDYGSVMGVINSEGGRINSECPANIRCNR